MESRFPQRILCTKQEKKTFQQPKLLGTKRDQLISRRKKGNFFN